jgi:hypothetical protein
MPILSKHDTGLTLSQCMGLNVVTPVTCNMLRKCRIQKDLPDLILNATSVCFSGYYETCSAVQLNGDFLQLPNKPDSILDCHPILKLLLQPYNLDFTGMQPPCPRSSQVGNPSTMLRLNFRISHHR